MGEVFAGRYELIDPIASGGMGTVWRVFDHADGQVKAAKMLRQSDAAMLLRFVREQSLRIDHTHIVAPQSWAGVDDRVLFTMPLVAGGSVSMLMRKHGALPPRWVGLLVDQTLQALEAVHAAGIVHRDVKPGNLLLEPTGRGAPHLRLTDFGIAVPVHEARLTNVAMVIGTPGYMAPEQALGADPAPSADIYALGMVTAEMLTGTRVPREPGMLDVPGLRRGEPAHDAVVEVIASAAAHDPAARPTAAQLRGHPSLRWLLGLPADPADPIAVTDVFPPLPTDSAPTQHPRPAQAAGGVTSAYSPVPTPVQPLEPATPGLTPARRSIALAPLLLLVVGLLGLAASGWLLLG